MPPAPPPLHDPTSTESASHPKLDVAGEPHVQLTVADVQRLQGWTTPQMLRELADLEEAAARQTPGRAVYHAARAVALRDLADTAADMAQDAARWRYVASMSWGNIVLFSHLHERSPAERATWIDQRIIERAALSLAPQT
jgi:hypothetical protein